MNFIDVLVFAIALSIDAMIVSFSNGLIFKANRFKKAFILAFTVGFFQWIMPIIGYFFSQIVIQYVKPYSQWLVFAIFVALGLKFIKDSFEKDKDINHDFTKKYLIAIGIATSIDALFAGVAFSFAAINIWYSAIIIGVITFINSLIGFEIAKILQNIKKKILVLSGGIILILLGFKVLFNSFI